ncbi:hypothetical protein HPB49_010433 [Dermacentor silvarum]|uniref:Uncharacterized protein n=1 Tax=Dermacentor silvarum TaxID=543639 RepID=A0ACB8CEM3_DERSI|nr:hypothetical protein HPB49_010433 [Dermacentor silvarum]
MGVLQLEFAIHRSPRCVNVLPFKRVRTGRRLAVWPSFLPSVPFLKFRVAHVVVLDMGYEISELGFHLIDLGCMCVHGVAECRELVADLSMNWLQFRLHNYNFCKWRYIFQCNEGEAARHEELGSLDQLRSKSQLARQSNKQQQNNARHIIRIEVVVEGEIISPEDFKADAGWMESHRQRRATILEDLNVEAPRKDKKNRNQDAEQREAARGRPRHRKQPQAPRLPELPKDDIKIILRAKEGLNVSKTSHVSHAS